MESPSELTAYQQARLGSICATHAEIAFNTVECFKNSLAEAKKELQDIKTNSERHGHALQDLEYIIQNYEEYIESTEQEVSRSEIVYDAACEQASKYVGMNTLGAFVLTVLSQKETVRLNC